MSAGQMLACACLCGIGFTMSLFVSELAFDEGHLVEIAKIAILVASLLSGTFGSLLLYRNAKQKAARDFRFPSERAA